MNIAEHILTWAENSQPHWRRLKRLRPGYFDTPRHQAYAAFQLAADTAQAMVRAGDLSRMELESADLLQAAKSMIEWKGADNGAA